LCGSMTFSMLGIIHSRFRIEFEVANIVMSTLKVMDKARFAFGFDLGYRNTSTCCHIF
jgi:hypothetical protein